MSNVRPIVLAALLWTLAGCASPPPQPSDWPRWRGPDGSGVSPERGWSSIGAAQPLWVADVGLGYSAPSISNGRLYTRGYFELGEKRGDDVTLCLDASTGQEIWAHASPAELWDNMHGGGTLTTPTVDGEVVFVLGRYGSLWALDALDGTARWEHDLVEEQGIELGFFGLSSSPVVVGDALIVNVGKTLAFDKQTGELRWQTRDYGYSYGTPVPFEWRGRGLLAVFNAVGLTVLEQDTGGEVAVYDWTSNYNVNSASPIVMGDRIFISTGYDEKGCVLLELSEDGLSEVWANRSMNSLMNACVLVGDHLYGFDRTMLECLDLDGKSQWTVRGLGRGALMASDGRLIVLSEEGELQIGSASPDGFEPTYRARVLDEGPCWTTPVLAAGKIYCRSSRGQLVCLDHRPGR